MNTQKHVYNSLSVFRKDDIIMMNMNSKDFTTFKEKVNELMTKYAGYEVVSICIDERIGRSSHKRATIEFVLEPVEDPE